MANRCPVPPGSPEALTWDELELGMRVAFMDIYGVLDNGYFRPTHAKINAVATVTRLPYSYEASGASGTAAFEDGTQVVEFTLDDDTVRLVSSNQWGFGPGGVEEDGEIHGSYYGSRYCAKVEH